MKENLACSCGRQLAPVLAIALGLWLGLGPATGILAAADATNVVVPATRGPVPTKLVVPAEWKVTDQPHDYKFEGLPLTEVTRDLQDQCKDQFDVLIPTDAAPIPQLGPDGQPVVVEQVDVGGIAIKLRLKGVSLIEVFQAMNMQFELERKPFRWELVMNGHRPVAALHILELAPFSTGAPPVNPADGRPQAVTRAVVFVGNLLTQEAGGSPAMKPEALCQILEDTARQSFPGSTTRKIQFHQGAELVVLTGTDEEVKFMKDVLQALTEKTKLKGR